LRNFKHLKYIPYELMRSNLDYLIISIETLIRRFKKMTVRDLDNYIKAFCGENFSLYHPKYPDLLMFLQEFPTKFSLEHNSDGIFVKLTDLNTFNGFCDFPVQIDKKYYEKGCTSNENSRGSTGESNSHVKSSSSIIKSGDVVSLIEEDFN
jgi:hypothetical protein